ncbi:hypothetical protein BDY19DRAFT_931101 [Irpex rosettiformis]|uniref:Uncharacterized protein n=1 Tax=Irpex rosettiformis TaxID=378272 RepID=A0ACB8UBI7_9APHY|nr:hypothetical protein BDY19DRAFT_931101 [Irpex rosettiformis]
MALDATPLEIFLHIIEYIEVEDVISLRKTCKALQGITSHRSVWFDILHYKIIRRGIPTPGTTHLDISSASARELEEVCIRAVKLRRNWVLPRPQYASQTSFFPRRKSPNITEPFPTPPLSETVISPDIKVTRCLALYFLPGRSNRYLVVILRIDSGAFRGPQSPPAFEIQCWDIAEQIGDPRPIAQCSCSSLLSACVNVDPKHPACLIITRREHRQEQEAVSFAFRIDFDSADQPKVHSFQQHSVFPSYKNAVRLEGSLFFASDETHCVHIINIDTGNVLYRLNAPLFQFDATVFPEEYKCLNSLIVGDFVLMFRQQWIHLYEIPGLTATPVATSTEPTGNTEPVVLRHVAEYKWPWRIDTVDVMAKHPHALRDQFNQLDTIPSRTQPPPPVHILVRFASIFPWPVNILHSYILPSNTEFDMTASAGQNTIRDHLPYLPTNASEASEELKPYIAASINSPVRIFTPSDTAMGGYGTILYMDAQNDASAVAQASDRGQRIAGKLLDFVSRPKNAGVLPRHAVDLVANEDTNAALTNEQLGTNGGDNSGRGGRGMVFHIQEDKDDWARIAMCEEEGIIVVGSIRDEVLVYRYI